MKVITKRTDYAIRALLVLAANRDGFISAKRISQLEKIPHQFLRGVLQRLVGSGIVESKEGFGGGVKLSKDPAEVKVIEIIRIFQGEIEFSPCIFRGIECPNRQTCVLRSEIKRIESLVEKEFEELTIKKLSAKTVGTNSARNGTDDVS